MAQLATEAPEAPPGAADRDVGDQRTPAGLTGYLVVGVALAMTAYHMAIAILGVPEPMRLRPVHLGFAMFLAFCLYPARPSARAGAKIPWYDWICAALSIAIPAHIQISYERIVERYPYVEPLTVADLVLGVALVLLILELTRRILGWGLVIVALAFILHTVFGKYMPGVLYHPGAEPIQFIDHVYLTTTGVYGSIVGISATFIFLFILFGVFLQQVGAADFFMKLAISATKRERGGPAKAATLSSAFFGMMSGSTVANIYTTGAITIPLMIRTGFNRRFAAGVEAVASASGQIMPPVMGATAFLIAEFTGQRYGEVALAAIAPGLLYLSAIYWMVHFQANKKKLPLYREEDLPDVRTALRDESHLMIPIGVLVVMLSLGYTPYYAAMVAIVAVCAASFLRRNTWLTPRRLLNAMEDGARKATPIAIAMACAGLIVATTDMTGVAYKFTSLILSLSDGSLFAALLLIGLSTILLGMDLPVIVSFIIASLFGVPVLIELGIDRFTAHMFVFYYAILAAITPPICMGAYAAASIAGSRMFSTGLTAMKIGVASYILPFMIAYNPELLYSGDLFATITATFTAGLGILALASAVQGYLITEGGWSERAALLMAAFLLMASDLMTDAIGIALVAGVAFFQSRRLKGTSMLAAFLGREGAARFEP